MPDRADNGNRACEHRSTKTPIIEAHEILNRTPGASDHDNIDQRMRLELGPTTNTPYRQAVTVQLKCTEFAAQPPTYTIVTAPAHAKLGSRVVRGNLTPGLPQIPA